MTHITDNTFTYQCQRCGETKPDTEFEPTGALEVCLACEKCKHENYDEYFDKCPDCSLNMMEIIRNVDNEADARDAAIYWQQWAGEQNEIGEEPTLFTSDLVEWAEVFRELGEKFDLTEEFEENGIL